MEQNVVGWFEIPVLDMERAKKFYDTVFDIEISIHNMNELVMGWFPFANGKHGASGSLVKHKDFYFPSKDRGTLVYFSCADVQIQLDRIESAGGKILHPKKQIGEGHGYMAVFLDSEGNRVALHSQK